MEAIRAFAEKDGLARHLGIELADVGTGTARATMRIGPQHLNSVGTVHGGAIFALADFVFAVASNSHGTIAVAINASISYLKAVAGGTLSAEGAEVALNPRLASYTIRVTDDAGDLAAIFQGMVYRKKDPIGAAVP
jgi:acyl-CoA thioesterase